MKAVLNFVAGLSVLAGILLAIISFLDQTLFTTKWATLSVSAFLFARILQEAANTDDE